MKSEKSTTKDPKEKTTNVARTLRGDIKTVVSESKKEVSVKTTGERVPGLAEHIFPREEPDGNGKLVIIRVLYWTGMTGGLVVGSSGNYYRSQKAEYSYYTYVGMSEGARTPFKKGAADEQKIDELRKIAENDSHMKVVYYNPNPVPRAEGEKLIESGFVECTPDS